MRTKHEPHGVLPHLGFTRSFAGRLRHFGAEVYQDEASALCLVPGLAFSANGARLGYGKGYYDTFFAQHPVLKLGLCYDFQLVPQVPTQPHDVRMDGILTDKRLVLTADEERME